MFGLKSIPSRRPCPQCGGRLSYVSTFLTLLTGLRKRKCQECGLVDAVHIRVVTGPAQPY